MIRFIDLLRRELLCAKDYDDLIESFRLPLIYSWWIVAIDFGFLEATEVMYGPVKEAT